MTKSDASPPGDQPDLLAVVAELETEQTRIAQVNEDRAERRGFLVFAIDPVMTPDEPGYRRVFATVANTKGQAKAKVRPIVPRCRLRAYLATGTYRDELAEAEWVQ